jgi:hypothetical protein
MIIDDHCIFLHPLLFDNHISLQEERIGMNSSLVTNLILK